MQMINTMFLRLYVGASARARNERGDVPGWVMITVMTATLVAGLTILARNQLGPMLTDALNSVRG